MHFVDAKGILSASNGMNIYRGCTHGCIYCDSRSDCYHITPPFEDVEVKQNAPELLEAALRSRRQKCMIGTGSMCDPYLPIEKELGLTRRCLELISRYGFGATALTKSDLILRDLDLFVRINKQTKAVVQMTLTTCDEDLCRILEPNVCTTAARVQALKTFRDHGVPTVVWLSPILPFINDTEENLRGILDCCFDAGVRGIVCFGFGTTIRDGDREYFFAALDRHFPGMTQRYIRTFGGAYDCPSPNNAKLWEVFARECAAHGVLYRVNDVFSYLHALPAAEPVPLF